MILWDSIDSTRALDLGPPALREKPDPMKRVTSSFRIRSMSSLKSVIPKLLESIMVG